MLRVKFNHGKQFLITNINTIITQILSRTTHLEESGIEIINTNDKPIQFNVKKKG